MRAFLRHALILGLVALAGAASVVGFGLYNVSARQGHWPGVSWILHTTYRNSVDLRAPPPSAVPDLASPDLVALGARHYDAACRVCHGTPAGRQSATVRAMVPAPPPITEAVQDWQPAELFWIVKHGVKMSGMPAWPTPARDDDVWPVVAFLAQVQDSASDYPSLVAPPTESTDQASLARCTVCHGPDGAGRDNQHVPRLDILGRPYIEASLQAYRNDTRQSGIMRHAASTLDDAAIATLTRHFASRSAPPAPPATPPDPDLVETGRRLATADPPDADIPTCSACHGPWPTRRSPLFPNLAGQHQPYLETQLHLWRAGHRGGTPQAHLMHQAATNLTNDQIQALAAFYAYLQLDKKE